MIWNETMECMDRSGLQEIQSERLVATVQYVAANCPPYRRKLEQAGIQPDAIQGLADLKALPFTTKKDLSDNYPFGLLSVPVTSIAEIHVSSGTTGNPTVVGYTREDLELWSEVMARCLACNGGHPGDMIQIAYGYGLFTGGLGFHYGALKMGMTVLPVSAGQTRRQLKLMSDFQPRLLACTPSYCLYMAEEAWSLGLDPRQSSWEIGSFGAEPWSESMRRQIESTWDMIATDVYGLSEVIGPGVANECEFREGLHVSWDLFYPEVVDPETGQAVPEGEDGELVLTTLTKLGMPLIRYRTRDVVCINYEKCRCGRTSPRISKIRGRTDDMFIVRGVNVFPSQIEHVLLATEGALPQYQVIVDRRPGGLDELEVLLEAEEPARAQAALEFRVRREIYANLGIEVKVTLVEPRTLERSEGKARRVVDRRQI